MYSLTIEVDGMPAIPGGTSGGFGQPGGPAQCTAMSKRSGKRCQGPAIVNSPDQKCRMHGGRSSTIGPANAQFKHGRHSRYLPSKLDELYREARSNPDLLDMADHIALLEARIQSVLADSADDPVPSWSDIARLFADVETAVLSGDMEAIGPSLESMHEILDAGMKWDTTWSQVQGTMEQLRKLTDTEVKRKKELGQMVPVERVIILMAAVGEAVKRHVTNPLEIQAVYKELASLHGSNTNSAGEPRVEPGIVPPVIDVTPLPVAATKRLKSSRGSRSRSVAADA